MNIDFEKIKRQAESELYEEKFREAVDIEKEKIRSKKSIWDIIFPFTIIIVKK